MIKAHDYVYNKDLPIIKAGWKGNPITAKNRFLNHEYPFIPKFREIFKWKMRPNPDAKRKRNDNWRLPISEIKDIPSIENNSVTWLGHASFLIKLGNKTILTDPILDSPTILMPRFSPLPIAKDAIKDIDIILISHDHRDHVDSKSLKRVFNQNPDAMVYTGLRLGPLLKKWTVNNTIIEAGWYQSYPEIDGLKITYLPCRHWSKRWINDTNKRLWGSFMIESQNRKVYFGSDSGYGSHYKDIHELFSDIDLSMIGIGAYKPEWFMHPSHTSPADAYQIAKDLKTRYLFPMHYGTFDLSDEAISDPYKNIQKIHESQANGPELLLGVPGQSYSIHSVSVESKANF